MFCLIVLIQRIITTITEPCSIIGSKTDCKSRGRRLDPSLFVEIDHEIVSAFILFLRLLQEGLVIVTDESMCTKY